MVVYKIKRGLLENLAGATLNAFEPAYTTDTNELFVADENGVAVKVSDHIKVEALPEVAKAVEGKYYVVIANEASNGAVHYFDGAKFIALAPDLSTVTSALTAVQASLVAMQTDIDTRAKQADLVATNTEVASVKVLAQKANDDLAVSNTAADAKYATKTEIADVANKTYVDSKITDLIGAAPEALNTLEEIAERLNNDSDAANAIKTLAEANRDAIATKANKTDLTTAENRITTLENKPSVAGTNILADGKTMAGDITFVATGEATISVDEVTKVVTINVPQIESVDGGTF